MWCQHNKVLDVISEGEIEEIWNRETPDNEDCFGIYGKYVWEAEKRVCDFINTHEDIINITTFGEYRRVMMKAIKVIKVVHNVERKRRQATRKKKGDELTARIQRTKTLIARIKHGDIEREEIERKIEEMFGKGSHREIENVTTSAKIIERIEDMSKTERQFEEWETMRREEKRRQREDRMINLFWRRNKTFPKQFGGDDETPYADQTLDFWRAINNNDVSEGWREDMSIREVLHRVKFELGEGLADCTSSPKNLKRFCDAQPVEGVWS